jgi:DNA polymerase-1
MRMQLRGFRLDVEAHAGLMADLARERVAAVQTYFRACAEGGHHDLAEAPVPSIPSQKIALLQALLTSDELAAWERTPRSAELSTSRGNLRRALHYSPIDALVRLSLIDKLLTSFGTTFAAQVSPITGRIHARYRVAGAASGRASCSGPNLQQVPRDPRFRALFKPEPGNVLIVADYSSMELRAAAHISGDVAMSAVFEKGLDLHCITAAQMIGKAPEEVTAEERHAAKPVNFGACYCIGARSLMKNAWEDYGIVITEHEATRWLRAFTEAYTQFARWRREHARRCEERRVIVIGRDAAQGVGRLWPLSRLSNGKSAYTCSCNYPVQGACADASMLALAAVDRLLFEQSIDGGPVAWLHDEIVMEVAAEDADRAATLLRQAMIEAFGETFRGAPLRGLVEPHIGLSWGEAKSSPQSTTTGSNPPKAA